MIETVSYVLCFLVLKKMNLKYRGALALFFMLVIVGQIIWQGIFQIQEFNFSVFAGLLFPLFCCRNQRKGCYLFFLLVVLAETLSYGFSVYIVSLTKGYGTITEYGNGVRILCLLLFPVCVMVYFCLEHFLFRRKIEILLLREHKITLLIVLLCSVMGLVIHVLMAINNQNMTQRMAASGLSFVCVTVIYLVTIFWQGRAVWKNQKLLEEQRMYDYLTQSQQKYLDYIIKRDEELRRFRHDIRAHMIIMYDMAGKKDCQGVQSYIRNVEDIMQRNQTQHFTGNSTVDAVMNDLKGRMIEEQIDFQVNGKIFIDDSTKTFDISICIYNVLLNAIEACEKLENDKKVILVEMEQCQNKIYINIKNPCNRMEDKEGIPQLVTDKKDSLNHGLGSKSVCEIVQRNGGEVIYTLKEGWFITELFI